MKNIFKISILLVVIGCMTACTSNYEDYNKEPYIIHKADPTILIPGMIESIMYVQQNSSQMVDQMVGSLGGYFTLSNRWGGQNFDTFNANDGWNEQPWTVTFSAIYANYFDIEKSTNKSGHFYAMAQLIRAAAMARVVDCYGPIPYSKVSNGSFYVEYDSAEDAYLNILADLTNSANILAAYAQEYPASRPLASADPVYAGDYGAWARFANSLRLRIAMRTGNQAEAEAAASHVGGLIVDNSQNAMMSTGSQSNPYQIASASWGDIRSNGSIVDYMNGYEDPRLSKYFQKSTFSGNTDKYIGMRAGTAKFNKGSVAGYSLPNIKANDALPVFVAAETKFLLAEAALRGWAVEGSAQENYEAGVRLSMNQYGVGAAADEYLANDTLVPGDHENDPYANTHNYDRTSEVKIMWDGEASFEGNLEQIITQKWIANYPMGLEAWAEFRRTGYPELSPTVDNLSGGVITNNARGLRRLRFPFSEQNLNSENYQKATALLNGKDNEGTNLFWAN